MIYFNKLVNHNCTDQTALAGLCLCCSQMPKTHFHAQGLFNVNLCLYKGTVSESGTGPLDYGATGPVPDPEPRL